MEAKPIPTHIGGQAVLEGVMLRGKKHWTVSVRRPDGEITSQTKELSTWSSRWPWLKWPIIRGAVGLGEAVGLGVKALNFSAQESTEEALEIGAREMAFTMVLGFALALGLFFALPVWLSGFAGQAVDSAVAKDAWLNNFIHNIVEGGIRIAIFFSYLLLVSSLKDIRRVFEYHGAEHKTIHAFEHRIEMEPEKIDEFSTMHVRCGTSFLLVVMVISIFIFALLGRPESILARIGLRFLVLPLVAGLSYEVIKFAGRHEDSLFIRIVMAPGLALQKLTTRPPSIDQIEVALASLNSLLAVEGDGQSEPKAVPSGS